MKIWETYEWDDTLTEEENIDEDYINDDYLGFFREQLKDLIYDSPIIIIADLGLWHGRVPGYKLIDSGHADQIFYTNSDIGYIKWEVENGELKAIAHHHDGTNYYRYKVFKDDVFENDKIDFLNKIYYNKITEKEILEKTDDIGRDILEELNL